MHNDYHCFNASPSFVPPVPSIYESEGTLLKVPEVGSVVDLRTLPAPRPGHSTVPVSHSHRQSSPALVKSAEAK